jgi:RNA polymerase sigma-70 factor (ECF subfamily)
MSTSTHATDSRTDAELVLSLQAGDARAFETIMRRHNRLMFRTARGIVRDDAEAQDVVQEAYLRAFTSIASWRGEAALSTWLARIAINVAIAMQRKRGRWISLDDMQQGERDHEPEAAMNDPHKPDAGPEQQAARTQMRELLEHAVTALPEIYRSVFMLRAVEEMSVEQTADALAVSQDVVKTRYLRARAMLRAALGTEVGGDLQHLYAFAGERCDAVVAAVLAELHARGMIRPH